MDSNTTPSRNISDASITTSIVAVTQQLEELEIMNDYNSVVDTATSTTTATTAVDSWFDTVAEGTDDIDLWDLPPDVLAAISEHIVIDIPSTPMATGGTAAMGVELAVALRASLAKPLPRDLRLTSSKPIEFEVVYDGAPVGISTFKLSASTTTSSTDETTATTSTKVHIRPAPDNDASKEAVRSLISKFINKMSTTITLNPPAELARLRIHPISLPPNTQDFVTKATATFPVRSLSAFKTKAAITVSNPFDVAVRINSIDAKINYAGHRVGYLETPSADFSIAALTASTRSPVYFLTLDMEWSAIAAVLKTYRGELRVGVESTMDITIGDGFDVTISYEQKEIIASLCWNIS